MSASTVPIDGPLGRFAADLLAAEFPDLPADRRCATVSFVCARCSLMPDGLRLGVAVAAGCPTVLGRVVGTERANAMFRRTRLPLVRELARLVRSLAVTCIWERWPDTTPLGGPGLPAGDTA